MKEGEQGKVVGEVGQAGPASAGTRRGAGTGSRFHACETSDFASYIHTKSILRMPEGYLTTQNVRHLLLPTSDLRFCSHRG